MVRFTKMHGAGNDFVCLDGVSDPALAARPDLAALAVAMTDRRRGVGGDGLIVITAPNAEPGDGGRPAVGMRMFNTDGTESAMCGNGVRCVAKYAVDHGLVAVEVDATMLVTTPAGRLEATCRRGHEDGTVEAVTVDMGQPVLQLDRVPVERSGLAGGGGPAYRVGLDDRAYEAVFVSMGNPHAVIYRDDVAAVDLVGLGPALERHPAFPQRMNVHFVEVTAPDRVTVRTWERGSGMTMACGSGACAVCVAGVLTGRSARRIGVRVPGGELELEWDEKTNHVSLTGPAVEVFSGTWP